MNQNDFQFIRDFVYKKAGIVLGEDKQYLVDSRLKPIIKEYGLADLSELVGSLEKLSATSLRDSVIDAVTTNETSFMRDNAPFEALRNEILPRLINEHQKDRRLNIWSAACSSGQEAYSVLMVLDEYFPQLRNWTIRFVCTDISAPMVERTKEGKFSSLEINRGLPSSFMLRYFKEVDGAWQVDEALRNRLDVRRFNLMDSWAQLPGFDLIFMRNVLIYFDPETKRDLLERAATKLNKGGVLLLGSSETTLGICEDFAVHTSGKCRYYKPLAHDED